jgi:hypothetical protein
VLPAGRVFANRSQASEKYGEGNEPVDVPVVILIQTREEIRAVTYVVDEKNTRKLRRGTEAVEVLF